MKIALVTDAWEPQINGVVTTLRELVRELAQMGHRVEVIQPGQFPTRPCPGYEGIELAVRPASGVRAMLREMAPDAIHIATEGPLGWAARRHCLRHGLAFTTAFHTRFPEILQAALHVPPAWGYALFRHFHRPSSGVMVPTQGVLNMLDTRGFRHLRNWTHGVDTDLFAFRAEPRQLPRLGALPRPVSLYVGRVSYEKNIEAFLEMDTPGTKVVCGVGPLEARLREQFPHARWLGVLPRSELAELYAAADVFVFPCRAETFGLVMLEAMACGTPIAAFPEDGPRAVLGTRRGGVLHADLHEAWQRALAVPRSQARQRALEFGWWQAARQFVSNLVPVHSGTGAAHGNVTPLSSVR